MFVYTPTTLERVLHAKRVFTNRITISRRRHRHAVYVYRAVRAYLRAWTRRRRGISANTRKITFPIRVNIVGGGVVDGVRAKGYNIQRRSSTRPHFRRKNCRKKSRSCRLKNHENRLFHRLQGDVGVLGLRWPVLQHLYVLDRYVHGKFHTVLLSTRIKVFE